MNRKQVLTVKRSYRRMDRDDRLRIEALWNAGHTYREIAHQLGFSHSSIYYEVKRSLYPHMGAECTKRPYHYSADIGQQQADFYATAKGTDIKLGNNHAYAEHVAEQVRQKRSPDVIVWNLRKKGLWTVSTTTLYRYIHRGYIPGVTASDLQEVPRRKKKNTTIHPAARPPKGTSIEHRPEEINSRTTFGHWEMDSIIGKAEGQKQSILTLTERLTRFEIVLRVLSKTAHATVAALDSVFSKFPKGVFKSITVDNGSEFQDCYGMEHDRNGEKRTDIYYCHPYSSSERGSNERNNRILRRFFPKGQTFEHYTSKDCQKAADIMNNMPRKILNYATPAELFQEQLEKFF